MVILVISLLIKSLLLFLITYILLKIFLSNAHKFGLLDIPNGRSAHQTPVPRGAGIIFGFVFILGVLMFYYSNIQKVPYSYVIVSLIIVYAAGIYDDINDVTSRKKFLFIT
jgi:UDP-N-acetylmuramyl pentapeptide phosphotransferase/UDP-N-acetylglucosamine-1-phosphate transferase